MGHSHIPKKHAGAINDFYRNYLNPFLCFHRFCLFFEDKINKKGKVIKVYNQCLTPVQKLLSIPNVEKYLKKGVTKEMLLAKSKRETHLQVAQKMQTARKKLFASFRETML